ncbi:hypothetical protein DYB37_013985, partial [Aphanomyces astaci]
MSLQPPFSPRTALPITHRLVGAENYDDWFLELTSIILLREGWDSMATQCTEVVGTALTEWLNINRSTNAVFANAIRADIESKLKAESAAASRACTLVQLSLSDTIWRDIAASNLEKCAYCIITKLRGKYCSEDQKHATAISVYQRLHAFKFRPQASLDAN